MVNIFVTDPDPLEAAYHLPDLLLPRMCLEAAEILCATHWNVAFKDNPSPKKPNWPADRYPWEPPYRRSLGQRKHPACKWAGASLGNYEWVLKWFVACADWHRSSTARENYHKSLLDCHDYLHLNRGRFEGARTPFILITENEPIKNVDRHVIIRYRILMTYKYLYLYKRKPIWTNRPVPYFVLDERILAWLHKRFGEPIRTITKKENEVWDSDPLATFK